MSFAIDDIVTRVRKVYPDMASADVIEALNQVRNELMVVVPLFRDTETLSSLVSGTKEYNISDAWRSISRVEYWTTSSAKTYLDPIDEEDYNDKPGKWSTSTGTPTAYYLKAGENGGTDGQLIGLEPTPNVSSSASYPQVRIYGSKGTTAYQAAGTMYDDMPNTLVLEYGVCKIFSAREDRENLGNWAALYEAEVARLDRYHTLKSKHLPESTNNRLENLKK